MFNEKDILARLQNGESVQKIADEMAAAINKANEVYIKEQAEKKREVQKKKELEDIINLAKDWVKKYYNVPDSALEGVDSGAVEELISAVEEYVKVINDLTKIAPKKNTDKTIDDFLKNMGW